MKTFKVLSWCAIRRAKPYTVRHDAVNAMLLNEFLKEHCKVEQQSGLLENQGRKIREQETTITELKKEMETCRCSSQRAGLKNPKSQCSD
jgi:hypothetical protein